MAGLTLSPEINRIFPAGARKAWMARYLRNRSGEPGSSFQPAG